ncbi:DUF6007 family protein [Lentibacillus juripiscarius]|uniref:DUF6007 family protein n=1 Tax=Lentibacillus juripiscarius TaxID=257446 RepID=A0ABW5V6N3_9BACI
MNDLKSALNRAGWLDLIFIVPMFLLFSYLPTYNFWSILVNVIVVVFFAIGLAMAFHIVADFLKKKND